MNESILIVLLKLTFFNYYYKCSSYLMNAIPRNIWWLQNQTLNLVKLYYWKICMATWMSTLSRIWYYLHGAWHVVRDQSDILKIDLPPSLSIKNICLLTLPSYKMILVLGKYTHCGSVLNSQKTLLRDIRHYCQDFLGYFHTTDEPSCVARDVFGIQQYCLIFLVTLS